MPFAYTVGLFLDDLPEFLVFGAPPELAQPILNRLATLTRDFGLEIAAGDELHQLIDVLPVATIGIDDPGSHLLTTFRMRTRRASPRRPIRAIQLVLPDVAGLMPWDDDYDWQPTPLLGPVAVTGRIIELPEVG